jgi:RNA polymerase sigma factor (sigma-70 family)
MDDDRDGARQPLAQLFAELQPQLRRILGSNLQVPEAILEDACQTAWWLLLIFRESIEPGSELGWLSTTATRQALKLARAQIEEEPFDDCAQLIELDRHRAHELGPERVIEVRERLAEIRELPVRQRRLVWLQGLGYEYVEIAAATGESRRTVERQLLRAHRRLAERSRAG